MRNISAWAIRNPLPPIVLFVVLTLLGIVSFLRMDVNAMPDVAFPAVQVTINQPGAAPVELETQVTQKVDAALASIGNVKDITSWDTEGQAQSMVQFQLGTPVDRAVNDARDAVAKKSAPICPRASSSRSPSATISTACRSPISRSPAST